MTYLGLDGNGLIHLGPLSGLTSLTYLDLGSRAWRNKIKDISALSGLTNLTRLDLNTNSLTDISALSGLTSLTHLDLHGNRDLSNIQPLLDNTGIGGIGVNLRRMIVSCPDVAALKAKGAQVTSDCP